MNSSGIVVFIKRLLSFVSDYRTTRFYSILINQENSVAGFFKRRKFEMRLFLFYDYHLQLLELFRDRKLHDVLSANARILDKMCRKYMIHGSSGDERFHILRSTYLFVRDNFSSDLIRAIFLNRGFPLCRITLPIQQQVIVAQLTSSPRFEKEGELTLGLYQDDGRRLYSVTFSIRNQGDLPEVIIGCILGPDKVLGAEDADVQLVRDLTKEMHGERPKSLVLFLLQVFCRHFEITRLCAVTLDSHIYGGDPSRRSRISSDYDEFWEELRGERTGDGFFSLPLQQHRRTREEIPSKKRAAYARRYALLDDLEEQMNYALRVTAESGGIPPQRR